MVTSGVHQQVVLLGDDEQRMCSNEQSVITRIAHTLSPVSKHGSWCLGYIVKGNN